MAYKIKIIIFFIFFNYTHKSRDAFVRFFIGHASLDKFLKLIKEDISKY